jgi:outer membrane protein assembly factor BamB
LLVTAATAHADNWPQWRGPTNDGICTEKNLPTEWSKDKNLAWKLALPGEGSSTPAIWGDKIFLTAQSDKKIVLWCVSTSGKKLWEADMGQAIRAGRGDEGNAASPSPSTDGKYVYVFSGNGEFAAFAFDGKEKWRFNAQERYGKFRIAFGMHSTPVLRGDRLYQQLIHEGGGIVFCIDKSNGKEVWKINRKSDGFAENLHSYASAFMWQKGKEAYLVVHGNDYATAHKLEDGKEIWRVGDLNPQGRGYRRDLRFVASPVCTPNLIVVPSAKGKSIVGLRPEATGDVNKENNKFEQWRLDKGTPDVPSPLVYDGLVYLGGEGGSLTVLDAKTGKQYYRKQVGSGRHRGSPVYADGKIYLSGRDDGTVSVVQAGKEYKLLAKNKLPDKVPPAVAISGGRIYIRGYEYLWAIEEKK